MRVIMSIMLRPVALAAWCLTLSAGLGQAAPEAFREVEVKAVFLYNFAQFVEWPQGAFPAADTPLRIGVLGDETFADILEQTVKGETVRGRPLEILRFLNASEVKGCHVLFVSRSEEAGLIKSFKSFSHEGLLTVGECAEFAACGGVINFYLQGNKIRFEINPEAARRNGLKISAQLLSLGKLVEMNSTKERR